MEMGLIRLWDAQEGWRFLGDVKQEEEIGNIQEKP